MTDKPKRKRGRPSQGLRKVNVTLDDETRRILAKYGGTISAGIRRAAKMIARTITPER